MVPRGSRDTEGLQQVQESWRALHKILSKETMHSSTHSICIRKYCRNILAGFFFLLSSDISVCFEMYIYVTVNLWNQIFPGIPNPLRESGGILKMHKDSPESLKQNSSYSRLGQVTFGQVRFTIYLYQGFPGFSKQVRDSGEYLVPQIPCNIYVYLIEVIQHKSEYFYNLPYERYND